MLEIRYVELDMYEKRLILITRNPWIDIVFKWNDNLKPKCRVGFNAECVNIVVDFDVITRDAHILCYDEYYRVKGRVVITGKWDEDEYVCDSECVDYELHIEPVQ